MAYPETQKSGLTSQEAKALQEKFGKNELLPEKKQNFALKVLHVISEPMFLLLLIASVIYFVLGEPRDGAVMCVFVVAIIGIDVFQEWKTDRTLKALRDLSAPRVTVIRDGAETDIESADLVPGDRMLIYEGVKIPADGFVIDASDLCVDESSLTGEAEGVWKREFSPDIAEDDYWRRDYCYAGTSVLQGGATILVDKIGTATEYGKIGLNVAAAPEIKTPLQKQTGKLVRICAIIAAVLFILVCVATWFNLPPLTLKSRLTDSILSGITLAMAMIPEEFPVVLTVFLSIGAWRLAKKNSLVRKLSSVETLGNISVLCVDKTGTITMNQMEVRQIWPFRQSEDTLCKVMGMACEIQPYDPMEKAMLAYCEKRGLPRDALFQGELVHEYAFTSELKMMGHVWKRDGQILLAAKGSPEMLLPLCGLSSGDMELANANMADMSRNGLRVIAVACEEIGGPLPPALTDCHMTFLGLIGLIDPPRESVARDIATCRRAGVRVVMLTGDNGLTAASIGREIGMENCDNIITGAMLEKMSDDELAAAVKTAGIFSRVIPEHKMRIVKAFQQCGDIVAMTGDGVNDAPALKHADIGIAMGGRGSEVSREAADLVLMDDNFSTIVDTIQDGRRIFDNIRRAVGYIFAIHIPIAFASLLAPILGVTPEHLMLLPLHVVLLELLIDPTCSIVLERQPAEADIMSRPPLGRNATLLTSRLLTRSLLQGFTVFIAAFVSYYVTLYKTNDAPSARTMGLSIIMLANLFLVYVNSSSRDSAAHCLRQLFQDRVIWMISAATVLMIAVVVYSPLNVFLKLAPLSAERLLIVLCVSFASVFWYEIVKAVKRKK